MGKHTRFWLVLALLPGWGHASFAAQDEAAAIVPRIELAYRAGDTGALEAVHAELSVSSASEYLAAYARLRQGLLAAADAERARGYLEDCIAALRHHTSRHPDDAQARALLGSCYGLSTRYNRLGLATRGLEARRHIRAAARIAPDNPWVVMQDGLADYWTPRLFGGSRKDGIAKVERATVLFGTAIREGLPQAVWGGAEAWEQLALMYRETGRVDDAERALAESVRLAPAHRALLAAL